MSNRVYLYCTNFRAMPTAGESDAFFKQCGVEYEAAARIPIFWLLLFGSSDVRLAEVDYGDGDAEQESDNEDRYEDLPRHYAYLLCDRASGVERLQSRSHLMKTALDDDQFALYEDWVARIATEPYANILVSTEELDCMGEAGQLEAQLRSALHLLEQADIDGMLEINEAIDDLTGIRSDDLHAYESFELVGGANSSPSWPAPFAPRHRLPAATVAPRVTSVAPSKPWWAFWR